MKRRNFLMLLGGGVILPAAAAGGFIATREPDAARAPWQEAGSANYEDPRLQVLSYAILAPNPHNRQPWLVELIGDNEIKLHYDVDRQLPHTDPFDRQLTIGFGCFLEVLRMAAHAHGFESEINLFPDGTDTAGLDGKAVAHIRLRENADAKPDPLWAFVKERRTNREPHDMTRPVAPDQLDQLIEMVAPQTALGGSVKESEITFWRDLTREAMRVEIETPHTYKESVDLFRIGKSEINANPDGIAFPGPFYETLGLLGMFTREAALDTSSSSYQQGIDTVLGSIRASMGHLWIVTPGNSREDQIRTGRDWVRANLAATALGLAFQPLSQALQEYPEMADHYAAVHKRLAPDGGTVQMLARIGYGPSIKASPRWPLETRLV